MAEYEAHKEMFNKITRMTFADQAKWFLNAFWKKGTAQEHKETIWQLSKKMEQATKKGAAGCDLDELEAHKFIEALGETLTVIELRERLRKIDVNNDNRMAMVEYLLFKYPREHGVVELCEAPQSDNSAELHAATVMVEQAQAALQTALANAESSKERKIKADSDAAAAAAAKLEAENSEAEMKKSMDELNAQEEAYKKKCAELEAIAGTPGVKGGQAAAELLKLKNENPLPLRKAQAEQAAAVKKAEKARKLATDAKNAADASAAAAAEAADMAEKSANEAEESLKKANFELSELKRKPGTAEGSIWYLERDLAEVQKFMPPKKSK